MDVGITLLCSGIAGIIAVLGQLAKQHSERIKNSKTLSALFTSAVAVLGVACISMLVIGLMLCFDRNTTVDPPVAVQESIEDSQMSKEAETVSENSSSNATDSTSADSQIQSYSSTSKAANSLPKEMYLANMELLPGTSGSVKSVAGNAESFNGNQYRHAIEIFLDSMPSNKTQKIRFKNPGYSKINFWLYVPENASDNSGFTIDVLGDEEYLYSSSFRAGDDELYVENVNLGDADIVEIIFEYNKSYGYVNGMGTGSVRAGIGEAVLHN